MKPAFVLAWVLIVVPPALPARAAPDVPSPRASTLGKAAPEPRDANRGREALERALAECDQERPQARAACKRHAADEHALRDARERAAKTKR